MLGMLRPIQLNLRLSETEAAKLDSNRLGAENRSQTARRLMFGVPNLVYDTITTPPTQTGPIKELHQHNWRKFSSLLDECEGCSTTRTHTAGTK